MKFSSLISNHINEERKGKEKMKKYIVKVSGKATENNPYFAGQEFVAYNGKNQMLLGYEGSYAEAVHMVKKLDAYLVKEYGYSRRCDAERSWNYRNPENSPYWSCTAEIIEIDVG